MVLCNGIKHKHELYYIMIYKQKNAKLYYIIRSEKKKMYKNISNTKIEKDENYIITLLLLFQAKTCGE